MLSLQYRFCLQRLLPSSISALSTRKFLSEAYPCTEAWNRRFQSPLLRKINVRDMFLELDKKLSSVGKVSAVDIDIFTNTMTDPEGVEELIHILHRFRMTSETSNTLESTHHATIRYLLDNNHIDALLDVLNDRLNYGIFPDHFTLNLMMNRFLKEGDNVAAVKVGSLLMFQEDSESPLSNALALYSCGKLLEEGFDKWILPPEKPVDPKEEVIKIRVRYLRNPFFDDHFDLKEPKAVTGKTFVFFGKLRNDTLGRSCLLIGYTLWGKYKMAAECIAKWRSIDGEVVHREALDAVKKELEEKGKELEGKEGKETEIEEVNKLKDEISGLEKMKCSEGKMCEEMEAEVKDAVKKYEESCIKTQVENFEKWEENRMKELQRQLDEIDRTARIQKVKEIKTELQTQERLLTFFEHEEEIELKIEDKLKWEEETYGPPITVKEDEEANYIPPEVSQRGRARKRRRY
ncbi:28S ribosomal protein S27, mitochondrial [Microplitis mediator]|uniref:28S ribosomal protein S27, mitochondrial n=1 Tax=Microplitis mediator TaxID=375433 RepID=UPI002557BDF4|nr:28S ribosomal protein S27, mitochondrial [Microplitis mediator]